MKDLTKGKPSKLILAFAIPIFMANILQLTYSIVDTRIVGSYLGENSLAAVGATTTLSNLMIGFLMGMAVSYIFIIIAGLVATFLYDACAAALRALGDTVTPLIILAVSVCLNLYVRLLEIKLKAVNIHEIVVTLARILSVIGIGKPSRTL